jgi:transcription elongation factor/antiterminator RfaH
VGGSQGGGPVKHWHALYTKANREHQVEAWLQAKDVETFLPTVRRSVHRRDRSDRIAYFPCYLFVRLDFDVTPRSELAWMPGIRRIVSAEEQPIVVSDEMVELIRRRLEEIDEIGYSEFRVGDRVRIKSGPFQDLDAVFDRRLSASQRVRILLNVLGRMTPIEIDSHCIERVSLPASG